jgi:hypothetical protein
MTSAQEFKANLANIARLSLKEKKKKSYCQVISVWGSNLKSFLLRT